MDTTKTILKIFGVNLLPLEISLPAPGQTLSPFPLNSYLVTFSGMQLCKRPALLCKFLTSMLGIDGKVEMVERLWKDSRQVIGECDTILCKGPACGF